jgi:hypothetical protein
VSGGFRAALDLSTYSQEKARQEGERYDLPERAGNGPLEASSCVTLVRLPEVIHDVNGYYRALGFTAPYTGITRKALRLAFHEIGGADDPYLIAVLQLLLDPGERFAYECASIGEKHQDSLQKKLLLEEVKRKAALRNPSTDTRATQREILEEMGFEETDPDGKHYPKEQYPSGQDDGYDDDLLIDPPWRWSYYRWGTGRADSARLGRWQELLVSALAALEVRTKFCVGFIGYRRTHSRFVVERTYGVRTVYLREDLEPDEEMAAAAADSLLTDLTE